MRHATTFAIAMCCFANAAWAADDNVTLIETGQRDDDCTATLQIENASATSLAALNGHVVSFVDVGDVGRSKGGSFLNITPGAIASAAFETPDAPCDQITSYRFLIRACWIDASFVDQGDCARRIETKAPITDAIVR